MKGGTYRMGGEPEARLNVTYNYSYLYARTDLKSLKDLEGKTGAESLPVLKKSCEQLSQMDNDAEVEKTKKRLRANIAKCPVKFADSYKQLLEQGDDNYWFASPRNAHKALSQALSLAQMRPDGIWKVC